MIARPFSTTQILYLATIHTVEPIDAFYVPLSNYKSSFSYHDLY